MPTPAWMIPAFSTRNSICTTLGSLHGLGDVHRHRADARVRHQPARTEHLTEAADEGPSCPASRCSGRSRYCPPAPRPSGLPRQRCRRRQPWLLRPWRPRANTATRTVRPEPFGSVHTPRTIWSACLGSTPRFIAISTVSSNFVFATCLDELDGFVECVLLFRSTVSRAARIRFHPEPYLYSFTTRPIERAEPAIMRAACSTSLVLRSASFV